MKRYKSQYKEEVNRNVGINVKTSSLPREVHNVIINDHNIEWYEPEEVTGVNIELNKNDSITIAGGDYPRGSVTGRQGKLILTPRDNGYRIVMNYYLSLRSY